MLAHCQACVVGSKDCILLHAGSAGHEQDPITSAHRRRAVCSLAASELKNGNTAEALRLYERLLGQRQRGAAASALSAFEHILGSSAVRAQPSPPDRESNAEHWAHGDYGWALFIAGRLEVNTVQRLPSSITTTCNIGLCKDNLRWHMLCRRLGTSWR